MLFPILDVDRRCFEDELAEIIPEKVLDMHTHVWKDEHKGSGDGAKAEAGEKKRTVSWPRLVARDNSIEDLTETYQLLLPGRDVTPMIFSIVEPGDDFDVLNGYTSEASSQSGAPALLFAHPDWSAEEIESKVKAGGFVGIKVYLNHSPSYLPKNEIRIYDFLPRHQLQVAHENRWIVMLHIPRDGRLRDRVNLAQMLEIDSNYSNAQVIIAHVGRAYCPEDIGHAFEVLQSTRNLKFDFSANTNDVCFESLLRSMGPDRVLYGSDLPILRMRMKRICEDGRYINVVPRGLYGDVSADPNMREVGPPEADELTFFFYEELRAFKRAAKKCGLSKSDYEAVFYGNGRRMLDTVGG